MTAVAVLQHRHPCPTCGKVWTHRVQPICGAYNGEPLRCGLCQAAEQAPALADRRWERLVWLVWAVGMLAVIGQSLAIVWALT